MEKRRILITLFKHKAYFVSLFLGFLFQNQVFCSSKCVMGLNSFKLQSISVPLHESIIEVQYKAEVHY